LQSAAGFFAAAFGDEIGCALRFSAIAENDSRSSLAKEADRRGSNAARTTGDEGNFTH
jgi:hypothetical protein